MVVKQYKQYRRHPVNNEKGKHSDPHGPSHQRLRKSPNNNSREDRPNFHNNNNRSNKKTLQQDPKNHLSRKTRNERTVPPPPTRQQQQHHPSTRKTHNTTSVVAESIDSYRAEMAAKRLEQELRQRGYDPKTGGKLLRIESSVSSSHSDDCDKYWQTPEQESRSLEEYYDHDDDHFDDYDEDDYTSTVYTDDRDDVDSRAHRSAYYTTDPRHNTRPPANDHPSKRHSSGRRHTSYHEQRNNKIDDDDLSSRRTLDWNTKSTPKRNSIVPKQQQRRRRSSFSSSSSSASSYSFLEEESFISKLQDPRSRNPDHPQQGFHSYVPRTTSRRVYNPSKPRAQRDGRDDIEQIDEDVSIFQLRKRTIQRDPPAQTEQQLRGATLAAKPMTKSSASASTRPIDNKGVAAYSIDTTTEYESDGNNNHTLRTNQNQNQHPRKIPTSPYHANDMAGRISPPKTKYVTDHRTQSQLHRPSQQLRKGNEKAVQEMSSQSFDVAVQKKNATDANTDKSVSDGAPPSNVVIVSDGIPNGINGPKKTTTIPSMATKPKPHTFPSCLMGKELLFVQERPDEDNIKSKSNILTTVPPVKKQSAVAALTTTPPLEPQGVTPPRKQPAFLLNRVLHGNTLDTHVLTSSGDIELQLSHSCSLPNTPYFDESNDHTIIHSTKKPKKPKIPKVVAGLSSALPKQPSKFLRKIIPAKKDIVGSTVGMDLANQVDNDGDPNHCSLVTKSELLQQGWSPGDIAESVEPGTADLSLFGRLIALRKEDNVQRRRAKEKTKALQNRVPKVEEEEVEEEEIIQSTDTEDWEVLSRESECISEESEKKQLVILGRQEMATSHRTTSSSFKDDQLREEPISNTKPKVHQISKMEDDVQKKFGGLFGRVLPPRKVSERKQANESYISSVQASRGSQSVPSVSGWSNSIASSTTHSENQKAAMLLGNQREKGTENTNASNIVGETRDTCSLSKEQKCDPPVGENGTLEEMAALPNAIQSIDGNIVEKAQADMPIQANSNQSVEMPKSLQIAESTDTLTIAEKLAKQVESSKSVESLLEMKSPVVQKVARATTEKDPVFVLSNDSDDGIPVPSVSVQELNAMLESRSTETEQEVTIEGNDSNDVSLQAVRSKKRVFGLFPRVSQKRQDCDSPVDLSPGRDRDMQQITKENQIEQACERNSTQLDLAPAQNNKTNSAKSLADSASVQSSIEVCTSSSTRASGDSESDRSVSLNQNDLGRSIGVEMKAMSQQQDASSTALKQIAVQTCGSIEDKIIKDNVRSTASSTPKLMPQSDRKNVRFADSLETFREIPPSSVSSSSTYEEFTKQNSGRGVEGKYKGSKKSLLGWISSRSRKRRSLHSKTDESLSAVSGEERFRKVDKLAQESTRNLSDENSTTRNGRPEASSSEREMLDDMESSDASTSDAADGIELIARRTKAGKNAILIANSAGSSTRKQRRGEGNPRNCVAQGQGPSRSSDNTRPEQNQPKQNKGRSRLSFFKRDNSRRIRARSKRQRHKEKGKVPPRDPTVLKNNHNSCMKFEEQVPATADSSSEMSAAANSSIISVPNAAHYAHQGSGVNPPPPSESRRDATEALLSLSEGDETPVTASRSRSPSPELAIEMAKAKLKPSSLNNPIQSNGFNRESSLAGRVNRASSEYSEQYSEPSNMDRHTTQKTAEQKDVQPSDPKPKVEDDWFSWLLPGIFSPLPVPQSAKASDPMMKSHDMGRIPSHGTSNTRKSTNSRYTTASRSTFGSSAYYGEDYSQDHTYSTPSVVSDDEKAVKNKRSIKKTTAVERNGTDHVNAENENVDQIPVKQWQEILDATEVLAMSYKQQKKHQKNTTTTTTSTKDVDVRDDNNSVSDDTIDEVKRAIRKFREHARLLGVKERELMEAVRDDDRSVPSRKHKSQQQAISTKNRKSPGNNNGGVTDKFIEMFDYFFVPNGA
ncbi:hypothetical protein IV203_017401 [Nitzschia inconspicua]|uniref:Uncharacterized protein n=1 Tax=Nitzschia inconspicua TaxID=303405 RepID=A0A9K3P866_9STRA|nr:hypothetical protein IV203_017586 [Nitzschia inconspicua]KAG7348696.1 hypothetical protein IV203_017401 [Nitzschia inconspicua]